uniref:TBC1 domain family member 13 n=1 Tax=Panthera onca TaxID=9690 RepID=UPI002952F26C|nr:TBC1 domain family member 13 [Panthera onca]
MALLCLHSLPDLPGATGARGAPLAGRPTLLEAKSYLFQQAPQASGTTASFLAHSVPTGPYCSWPGLLRAQAAFDLSFIGCRLYTSGLGVDLTSSGDTSLPRQGAPAAPLALRFATPAHPLLILLDFLHLVIPFGSRSRIPAVPELLSIALEELKLVQQVALSHAARCAPASPSASRAARIADFQDVLKEPTIALEKLRELSFSGIPCEGGLRCLCWKILLNYLPLERASWTSILAKQRELYSQFLREMIIQPGIAKANMGVSREDVTFEDHPLNPNPDSRWNTYFKDNEVLLQIDKDVRRLCPDISFFQRATEYPCLLILDPQNEFETLRKRVEQTTLKSQTVARNRSGVTNVRASPGAPGTPRDSLFLPASLGALATGRLP